MSLSQGPNDLILCEMTTSPPTSLHPSIPTLRSPQFSPFILSEHTRLASALPKVEGTGIDLNRYSALERPANPSPSTWNETLRQASTSAQYLQTRSTNLALLETYGKNAWLVSNSQLEDELKALETEVEAAKVELEAVERERRVQGDSVGAEVEGLEKGWREGVGRMIEALAAGERVRGEILEKRRAGAAV